MPIDDLEEFDLEKDVTGGFLEIDPYLGENRLKLEEIPLSATKDDCLIHIEYLEKEKRYSFKVYRKKD